MRLTIDPTQRSFAGLLASGGFALVILLAAVWYTMRPVQPLPSLGGDQSIGGAPQVEGSQMVFSGGGLPMELFEVDLWREPPPVIEEVVPPPPVRPALPFRLMGVSGTGPSTAATFYDEVEDEIFTISIGEDRRGYRIASASDGVLKIERNEWTWDIELSTGRSG